MMPAVQTWWLPATTNCVYVAEYRPIMPACLPAGVLQLEERLASRGVDSTGKIFAAHTYNRTTNIEPLLYSLGGLTRRPLCFRGQVYWALGFPMMHGWR